MKTTPHTPGPWKYHLGNGTSRRFHIQHEGGYQIASTPELVTPKTAKQAKDFDENNVRESNARLIAAAPELLAALDRLSDALAGFDDLRDDDSRAAAYADELTEAAAAQEQARAAIAKAQGES